MRERKLTLCVSSLRSVLCDHGNCEYKEYVGHALMRCLWKHLRMGSKWNEAVEVAFKETIKGSG